MLLDRFLPTYDFNEVHSAVIRAGPDRVFHAIKSMTPSEMPLVRLLFVMRGLPARLAGRRPIQVVGERAILDQALNGGFVLLAEIPNQELVLGTVGQFWTLRGGPSPVISTPQEFIRFDSPGYAKAAMNFSFSPAGAVGVRLVTETRILALDPESKRKCARYWRVIYPGSALIRRMWLRAIKCRAERSG